MSAGALPRRVLLTGASGGIGRAIAQSLLDAGVRLALVGRDLRALSALLPSVEGHALIEADLARVDEVEACVDRAADMLGGLDALIACAGVAEHAALGEISPQTLAHQMTVNFTAPFLMAQRAIEPLASAGGGSLLLVTSTLGLKPAIGTAAYAASKAALISMTQSFALELAARGIRVNAVAPGVVDTRMVRTARVQARDSSRSAEDVQAQVTARLESLRREHPLGRLGHPQEIAETALFLLRSTYITGAVVAVDGGLLLGNGAP